MKKQLIAKTRFNYGSKQLRQGSPFEASEVDAKILVGINKATYQTRDMVAEHPASQQVLRAAPPAISPPQTTASAPAEPIAPTEPEDLDDQSRGVASRRRYRRRDTQAASE